MRHYKKTFMGIMGLVLFVFICSMAIAAEQKSITGEINEGGQLVAEDGEIYDLVESDKAAELFEMGGKKVIVTGTVSEGQGAMTIDVMDYKVIE